MRTRFSYITASVLLVGCGPSLDQVARTTQGFAIQKRCSQGPFELHVPAFGSKWGEDVTLETRGNAVAGHASIYVDGVKQSDTTVEGAAVDATACVLSDADRTAVPTGTAAQATSSVTTATPSSDGRATHPLSATVALLEAGVPSAWMYRTEVARYHKEVDSWDQASSVLKHGQDVKIVFWSEKPLDLQNTVFVLTHSEMVARGGNDKKWQAHLDDVKSDAEKARRDAEIESKKAQAEATLKANEQQRCADIIQGADKKCHDEGYKTRTELVAYSELQRRCEALAKSNATDQACRDDGWRNANERPDYPQATTTAATQSRSADRPPPPPQTETPPPKPSTNAEWIAGSWQWSGSDWAWLSGGWRVPEQDRAQKLTATAPSAPPMARVESRPPQPIASAVWADGYWHYAAGQWVWVPGHWAVPPRTGATWRPSTWISDGVQLRLDPGGWR